MKLQRQAVCADGVGKSWKLANGWCTAHYRVHNVKQNPVSLDSAYVTRTYICTNLWWICDWKLSKFGNSFLEGHSNDKIGMIFSSFFK